MMRSLLCLVLMVTLSLALGEKAIPKRAELKEEKIPLGIRHRASKVSIDHKNSPSAQHINKAPSESNLSGKKSPVFKENESDVRTLRSNGGFGYSSHHDSFDANRYGDENFKERFAAYEPKKHEKHGHDSKTPNQEYGYEKKRVNHEYEKRRDYDGDYRPRYDDRDFEYRPKPFDYDRGFDYPPPPRPFDYDRPRGDFYPEPYFRDRFPPDFHRGYDDFDYRSPSINRRQEFELLFDLERLKAKSLELDRLLEKLAKDYLEVFGLKDIEKLVSIKQLIDKPNEKNNMLFAGLMAKLATQDKKSTEQENVSKAKTLFDILL